MMGKHRRFYINVWDGCNLACKHCFNAGGEVHGKSLSTDEIVAIISQAIPIYNIEEVQLTGGEPTQRPDIFILMEKLLDVGLVVLLQTNGVLDATQLKKLIGMPHDKIRLIISLDGFAANDYFRGKNATRLTLQAIEQLAPFFEIRFNTLLSSKIQWDEIKRLADIAKRLDVTLAFNPVCPSGRAEAAYLMAPGDYFDYMYRLEGLRSDGIRVRKCFDFKDGRLVENENCPVRAGTSIHVAADGTVSPCGFLVNHPLCQMGSLCEKSMPEAAQNFPSICKVLSPECRDCDYYKNHYCNGGCPARIYALHHSFFAKDIYCMADYYKVEK